MTLVSELVNPHMLSHSALKIFAETLLQIDAKKAVQGAVRIEGSRFFVMENVFELNSDLSIYVVAVGKAAYPMAVGFSEIAGKFIKGGILSGVVKNIDRNELGSKWQIFQGGHPLPNDDSFNSARACFDLLSKADSENTLIVFLVSGGGSAMMDLPRNDDISLPDLQNINQTLITSSATIAEINSVRRAISLVKGGGLARLAPHAKQISLIISDTSDGDISSVASGPSVFPANDLPDAMSVTEKYNFTSTFPESVVRTLKTQDTEEYIRKRETNAHVLLDNKFMVKKAAKIAKNIGFKVKIDEDADDVPIENGCKNLISEFVAFRKSTKRDRPICFISGGEFSCEVNGNGIGGRNAETVLRLSLLALRENSLSQYAILSAGTDGIDGNSPAAGAVTDQTFFKRAMMNGIDPRKHLGESDSFSFFNELGDAIITGATGTNVRDLRILLSN